MKSHNPNEFEDLAMPLMDLVYRVARRLAKSDHEAEDLVQETYLKAFKAFERFELRDYGMKPWLLRILHNTFLNRHARELKSPITADTQALAQAEEATDVGGSIEGPPPLDYEQMDEEVKNAIDALSPEYRPIIVLWGTMELSYQEIADALDVPIGTVMSRLHRARQQLTQRLSAYAQEHRLIGKRGQS